MQYRELAWQPAAMNDQSLTKYSPDDAILIAPSTATDLGLRRKPLLDVLQLEDSLRCDVIPRVHMALETASDDLS